VGPGWTQFPPGEKNCPVSEKKNKKKKTKTPNCLPLACGDSADWPKKKTKKQNPRRRPVFATIRGKLIIVFPEGGGGTPPCFNVFPRGPGGHRISGGQDLTPRHSQNDQGSGARSHLPKMEIWCFSPKGRGGMARGPPRGKRTGEALILFFQVIFDFFFPTPPKKKRGDGSAAHAAVWGPGAPPPPHPTPKTFRVGGGTRESPGTPQGPPARPPPPTKNAGAARRPGKKANWFFLVYFWEKILRGGGGRKTGCAFCFFPPRR